MSQVDVSKLVSKLRYNLKPRRKLQSPEGPQGRHDKIRKTVTALFKYERIELNSNLGDESRGYAERLISDAIKYGDCHKETMKMASYWLLEKQLVHKLFKVLVPRYQNFPLSYTKMWKAPSSNAHTVSKKCVLELRNNIYPPLAPDRSNDKNLIHNILLSEAKKVFDKEKALKVLQESELIIRKSEKGNDMNTDMTQAKNENEDPSNNIDINIANLSIQTENASDLLARDSSNLLENSDSIESVDSEGKDITSVSTNETENSSKSDR